MYGMDVQKQNTYYDIESPLATHPRDESSTHSYIHVHGVCLLGGVPLSFRVEGRAWQVAVDKVGVVIAAGDQPRV